jgi:hypothetical protein
MLSFLQVLFSFPTILVVLAIFGIIIWKVIIFIRKHPSVLLGTFQLIQSPSGIFALLTLAAITLVTLKQPSVGGSAFTAFCAIIPAALGFFEHKETMAGVVASSIPTAMAETLSSNPAKPDVEPTA